MCNCHFIPECCVMFSGVKLSIRLFNLFHQTEDSTRTHQNLCIAPKMASIAMLIGGALVNVLASLVVPTCF